MFIWKKIAKWPQSSALALIWIYQKTLSPLKNLMLGAFGGTCRFYPTCSCYARECLCRHGFFKGCILSAIRLVKCQPFHPGGVDLPPVEWDLSRISRRKSNSPQQKSRDAKRSRLSVEEGKNI